MRKLIFTLTLLTLMIFPSGVKGDEILLKNGNKIDYGPTWEKDGMVWFYFHDYGVVGISKEAIVDKKGILGSVKDNYFVSSKYKCKILVPDGWHAANAVEALDVMPIDEGLRKEYKKLEPQEIMRKMGFLVTIFQNDSWDASKYNPNIIIKIEDREKYPGVNTPLDYLKNSELLLSALYEKFKLLVKPQPFILNNIPSAKQKFSCRMVINDIPFNITQWQYAFVRDKKVYVVAALNTTEDFKNTEKLFIKTLKSFKFLD